MAYNPFTTLPITLCGADDLPAFAQCQTGSNYIQLRSQVSALLILPVGATPPDDWELESDWSGVVDNTNTDNTKVKYIVGRGSFLQNGLTEINLSGGRRIENRERFYRLTLNVLNTNDGHADFARKLQKNIRDFDVWIQTLGDRIIGGEYGMRPFYVNADFLFTEGNNDREVIQIVMDFAFEHFPEMTSMVADFNGTPIEPAPAGSCDCDIQDILGGLSTYTNDAAAASGGLAIGDVYIAGPGHDRTPVGDLTTRLS